MTPREFYKPHDRSPSAQQVVWTLTGELRSCLEVVKDNRTEWKIQPPPPMDEMLAQFERWPMGGKVPAIYGPSAYERPS